ncbi:MAG TPA: hypothetical protein PLX60_00210 [Chitinophagales bacterium]|jgi:hypothetical protein|nr:hypothetical protein [Chitinophagales bacterium]HPH87163.1 hypothetical protein [Chitinophagales bacterium]
MKLIKFTFIFLFFFTATGSYAQKGGSISVGATPGLSYMLAQNTYFLAENSKELDYKPKFSYHVFVEGGYNFKEQHGFVAFANYCQEGQNYEDEFKWRKYPALIGKHQKSVDFKYMGFGVLYRFAPLLRGQKDHIRITDDNYHWRMKLLVGFETDFMLDAQMTYKITPVGGNPTTVGYPIDPTIGGYPSYTSNQSDNYKSYFKTIQGVGVIRFGFDYLFNNNMFLGIAMETKFGLNDINASAYRVHPDYKKSKNYFFGLNVEVGYAFKKGATKKPAKKEEVKPEKVKTPGLDMNKRVDEVDKATKKKYKK